MNLIDLMGIKPINHIILIDLNKSINIQSQQRRFPECLAILSLRYKRSAATIAEKCSCFTDLYVLYSLYTTLFERYYATFYQYIFHGSHVASPSLFTLWISYC